MAASSTRIRMLVAVMAAVSQVFNVASAAEPGENPRASARQLEHSTRLDLSREWSAYRRADGTRTFPDFVDHRYRVRRDLGRGLVTLGASLFVAGGFFLSFGVSDNGEAGRPMLNAGYATMAASAGVSLVGAVLWAVYFRRLDRLQGATLALGPRGRIRLEAAPPRLSRGAAMGIRLTF